MPGTQSGSGPPGGEEDVMAVLDRARVSCGHEMVAVVAMRLLDRHGLLEDLVRELDELDRQDRQFRE